MKKLLLTVNVITYNHRPWVEKCLDSILEQETDFDFIVRIFDDCSTDGTLGICEQYVKKHPEKVFLYPSEKNLGPKYNPLRSYQGITTPYYLYIEGDDCRINPKGFQRQIDILEEHPECSFCAAQTINYRNNSFTDLHPIIKQGVYTKEYIKKNVTTIFFCNLLSRIVRTSCIEYPDGYEDCYLSDSLQFYELIKKGHMYFIDEIFACYNETGFGVQSGSKLFERTVSILDLLKEYNKFSNEEFKHCLFFVFMCEIKAMFYKDIFKELEAESGKRVMVVENFKLDNNIKLKNLLRTLRRKFLYMILPGFIPIFAHAVRDYLRILKNRNYK